MAITIRSDRAAYFADIFPLALKGVVAVGEWANPSKSYADLEGFVLSGWGHEAMALLLLDCLSNVTTNLTGDVLEELVLRSLVGCKIDGRPDKDGFLTRLQNEIGKRARSVPTSYRCSFLLQSSSLPEWVTSTRILGHTLRRAPNASWKAMARDLPEICARVGVEESWLSNMQLVEMNVRARRPIDGINIADQVSRTLRGAYLLSKGGSWTVVARTPSAANPFRPSPFYCLRSGRTLVEWAFMPSYDRDCAPVNLPDECSPRTKLVLNALAKAPGDGSVQEVLSRALILYATAGDAPLEHDRFLGMWQALESLSFAERGDTTQVARNIGNLWRNGNETIYYQLVALAPFRNKLVHVGEYDSERQSATFLLNRIAQDAILQFTQLSTRLKTKEHFREFMSMMTFSKNRLAVRAEAMTMVRTIRGL